MEKCDKSIELTDPLAFRLRQNVSFAEKKETVQLCLSYPLKTISLNLFWGKVMALLSKGYFVSLDDILSITGSQRKKEIELFLYDLVRRGFLEQTGLAGMETLPSISVIIPVYNRSHDITGCLDSLCRLDYPKEKLEIIVVDDASTDKTPVAASCYPVKLIRNQKNRQAPYCRNLGAQKANGDILTFIDSDCLADRKWLMELVPAFKGSDQRGCT